MKVNNLVATLTVGTALLMGQLTAHAMVGGASNDLVQAKLEGVSYDAKSASDLFEQLLASVNLEGKFINEGVMDSIASDLSSKTAAAAEEAQANIPERFKKPENFKNLEVKLHGYWLTRDHDVSSNTTACTTAGERIYCFTPDFQLHYLQKTVQKSTSIAHTKPQKVQCEQSGCGTKGDSFVRTVITSKSKDLWVEGKTQLSHRPVVSP